MGQLAEASENINPLPSEGRGREFESRRVRHVFQQLSLSSDD